MQNHYVWYRESKEFKRILLLSMEETRTHPKVQEIKKDKKDFFWWKTTLIHGLDLGRYLDSQPMGLKQKLTNYWPEPRRSDSKCARFYRFSFTVSGGNGQRDPVAKSYAAFRETGPRRLSHGACRR